MQFGRTIAKAIGYKQVEKIFAPYLKVCRRLFANRPSEFPNNIPCLGGSPSDTVIRETADRADRNGKDAYA